MDVNIQPLSFARTVHTTNTNVKLAAEIALPLKSRIMSERAHLQKCHAKQYLKLKTFLSRIGAYFALEMKQ